MSNGYVSHKIVGLEEDPNGKKYVICQKMRNGQYSCGATHRFTLNEKLPNDYKDLVYMRDKYGNVILKKE